MSRIRTVKPEFWVSEQVSSCSLPARLLFIGMWNFCDDNGVHPTAYVRLKAEVYPCDNFTADDLKKTRDDLTSTQQVIDEHSTNLQGIVDERSPPEGNGRALEGKGSNTYVVSGTDSASNTSKLNCPHEQIVNLYHDVLPMCPEVRIWNKTRRSYLQQRWKEDSKHQVIEFWKNYFEYVKQSNFLTGKTSGKEDKPPFIADLEWLVRPNNFVKIIEGKYHHKALT